MNKYEFLTANGTTCTLEVSGTYTNGCKDLDVTCGDYWREYDEIDAGMADEVFADLLENGVRFESKRSLVANVMIAASVLLDHDSTVADVLAGVDAMTEEELDDKLDYYVGTTDVTA